MIKRISGEPNIVYIPKTASTALTAGTTVKVTSGQLAAAGASDSYQLGVLQKTILSTDSDYTSTTAVPVDLFDAEALWEADVTNAGAVPGTLTTAMVGEYFKIDAAATPVDGSIDSNTATTTAGSGAGFVLVQFISASKGVFKGISAFIV